MSMSRTGVWRVDAGLALTPARAALGAALLVLLLGLAVASPAVAGKRVDSVVGTQGSGNGQFDQAVGVAVRNSTGDVYVVDATNNRIVRFDFVDFPGQKYEFDRAWGWDVVQSGPGNTGTGFEICVAADGDVCKAGVGGGGAGQFPNPMRGIAIDQITGDVYVTGADRVQRFAADGTWERLWGRNVIAPGGAGDLGDAAEICTVASDCQSATSGTLGGQFTMSNADMIGVAVDATGDVFVSEPQNRRISKFDADGNFERAFGWDVVQTGGAGDLGTDVYEVCTVAAQCKAAGSPSGFAAGQFGTRGAQGIAVDAAGDLYAIDRSSGDIHHRVLRFEADGSAPAIFADATVGTGPAPIQIAADPTGVDDHIYVMKPTTSDNSGEQRVWELDTAAVVVDDSHYAGALMPPNADNGLALRPNPDGLDPAGHSLYLTTSASLTSHRLVVADDDGGFDPASTTILPPTDLGAHEATLNALIDPNGSATTARFELSLDGVTWEPAGPPIDAGSGTGDQPVSQAVTGLQANAFYRVRIVVTTIFAGSATSAEVPFLTDRVPPDVTTTAPIHVADTAATLRGRVNPNNLPTAYHFEYGTTTSYGSTAPVPDGDAGSGGVEQGVSFRVDELLPGVTYHYRLVATNDEGTAEGADRTFTTREADVTPPPGRGYEMVTPPFKNNRITGRTLTETGVPFGLPGVPAPDGEAIFYAMGNGILDPEGGTAFPHATDPVVIRREPDRWRVRAINDIPAAAPGGSPPPVSQLLAASTDFATSAWVHDAYLFDSKSTLDTNVMGDTGGLHGSGWYDWLAAAPYDEERVLAVGLAGDNALLTDDGGAIVRWGRYQGLLGPGDPSSGQIPDDLGTTSALEGGRAVYIQQPPGSGPKDTVNGCTGTGAEATLIPERDANGTPAPTFGDDLIDAQPCTAGSPTSLRGATVGTVQSGPVLGSSTTRALSSDGRRVFFLSPDPEADGAPTACGLVNATGDGPGTGTGTDCTPQVYVRQYDSNGAPTVRWLSRTQISGQAIGLFGRGAYLEGASEDGRFVYFRTNAPLTADDPNGTGTPGPETTGSASDSSWDLYRYELPASLDDDPDTGTLTRISGGPAGTADPNTNCSSPQLGDPCDASVTAGYGSALRYASADGSRIYFVTAAPIPGAVNDPPDGVVDGPTGSASVNGTTRNLYAYDDSAPGAERWRFIARIPFSQTPTNIDACASFGIPLAAARAGEVTTPGQLSRNQVNCFRGTDDGRFVAFETKGRLTEDDDDDASDIYSYDADLDRLERISAPPAGQDPYHCGSDGQSCNADLGFTDGHNVGLLGGGQGVAGAWHWNVAEDRSVYFESRLELVAEDVNGTHYDVYRWHAGDLTLMSPGSSDDHAFYSGNSVDGTDVFFWTSQRIDPREIESDDFDVYDARVGGGFPPPPEPPGPGCDPLADDCQGPGSGGIDVPDDTTAPGDGNVSPGARKELLLRGPNRAAMRRAVRTGTLRLAVRSSARGRLTFVAKARLRPADRPEVVARERMRLPRPGKRKVSLRLSDAALRALRERGQLSVVVRVRQRGARAETVSFVLRRAR